MDFKRTQEEAVELVAFCASCGTPVTHADGKTIAHVHCSIQAAPEKMSPASADISNISIIDTVSLGRNWVSTRTRIKEFINANENKMESWLIFGSAFTIFMVSSIVGNLHSARFGMLLVVGYFGFGICRQLKGVFRRLRNPAETRNADGWLFVTLLTNIAVISIYFTFIRYFIANETRPEVVMPLILIPMGAFLLYSLRKKHLTAEQQTGRPW